VRKEAIRIEKVIVHILDALSGLPALSDTPLEFGSELADFLKEHGLYFQNVFQVKLIHSHIL